MEAAFSARGVNFVDEIGGHSSENESQLAEINDDVALDNNVKIPTEPNSQNTGISYIRTIVFYVIVNLILVRTHSCFRYVRVERT